MAKQRIRGGLGSCESAVFTLFLTCAIIVSVGAVQPLRAQTRGNQEQPLVQQIAIDYYTAKYHASAGEARRGIELQDQSAGIEDDLANLLGDQFAGIWYDHSDRGRLKIGMTRIAMRQAAAVGGLVNRYGVGADTAKLFMNDVISRNNFAGLRTASAILSIEHCRFENNSIGVDLLAQTTGTIWRSVIAGNTEVGLQAPDDQGNINVENCGITNNGKGIQSSGVDLGNGSLQAIFYVSNTLIAGNKAGLAPDGGQIISYGNNQLANNLINGAFTSTITQQ